MDEYRSLYRKYRPQAPDQVLGQEHVVRALAGAVREGRLAHAFLFSGPRGTGKTSTARILAKMVNCENGPTAEPCGVCEQCVRIRDGSHLDVIEIDAASHGGVDDARELRERAPTAPAQGREKVYILDEAQRLSREAFDALLKLFEEPPPGVRFVLATTEPHKMPATIVGRCQKFEFRRIPVETIAAHLQKVAADESVTLDSAAAEAIARESEGSARDALSLLDQAATLGGGNVTEEIVGSLTGMPELEVQFGLADAIAVGDAKEVFGIVHRLVQEGHDLRHLTTQVTTHFRNLLLSLASPDDPAIVDVPPEVHPRLLAQSQKFSPNELDRILALLLQAQTDLRWSTAPRLTLELALIRSAMPETDPQPAALLARLERLERLAGLQGTAGATAEPARAGSDAGIGVDAQVQSRPAKDASAEGEEMVEGSASGSGSGGRAPRPVAGQRSAKKQEAATPATGRKALETEPGPAQGPAGPPSTSNVDAQMLRGAWLQVLDTLKANRKMQLHGTCQLATVGTFDGETLELIFPPGKSFAAKKVAEKKEDLIAVLRELFGIGPTIVCTVREGLALEPDTDEPLASPEAAEELLVKQFGAEVVEEE